MAKTTRPARARGRQATQPPEQEFGNLTAEGTANIDPQKLLEFKTRISQQGLDWSKVKFVARNAPFNR
jgi:hypothetical protein